MQVQHDITADVLKNLKNVAHFKAAYALGLLRLVKVEDNFYDFADMCRDMFKPEANPEIPVEKLNREKRNYKARVNRLGVWDVQLQGRALPTNDWQVIDAMGGNIGDDWIGSGYEMDYIINGENWINQNGGFTTLLLAIQTLTQ